MGKRKTAARVAAAGVSALTLAFSSVVVPQTDNYNLGSFANAQIQGEVEGSSSHSDSRWKATVTLPRRYQGQQISSLRITIPAEGSFPKSAKYAISYNGQYIATVDGIGSSEATNKHLDLVFPEPIPGATSNQIIVEYKGQNPASLPHGQKKSTSTVYISTSMVLFRNRIWARTPAIPIRCSRVNETSALSLRTTA